MLLSSTDLGWERERALKLHQGWPNTSSKRPVPGLASLKANDRVWPLLEKPLLSLQQLAQVTALEIELCQSSSSTELFCWSEIPAEMIAQMLQYHRNQENLECESRQIVVQEKCFLHQEEGQVIHSPASTTDASRWYPELPGICRRQEMGTSEQNKPQASTWTQTQSAVRPSGMS